MKRVAEIRLYKRIATLVSAMRYCEAAKRDEWNGFVLTAAWEWRQAAELSASILFLADHCWREWERIMHLPRQLSGPIDDFYSSASVQDPAGHTARLNLTGEFCPIRNSNLFTGAALAA
jgi:hypothetical protein